MKKIIITIILSCIAVILLSCFRKEDEVAKLHNNIGPQNLESFLNSHKLSEDEMTRGRLAMKQWKNGKVDPKPILICARLVKDKEGFLMLFMYYSDEDHDVAGFGIREEHFVAKGNPQIIEEAYPLFRGSQPLSVWLSMLDVDQRIENKRKDEKLWQEYINKNSINYPKRKPPIIISFPEPNQVDIWAWLYDRAENQSDFVKVDLKEKDTFLDWDK